MNRSTADRLRPGFHITCDGYLNDPNGLIDHDGVYHLFYQHHPSPCPSDWWNKRWAHATSSDLLHWRPHGLALQPDTRGVDEHGCWSGTVVIRDGQPTVLYTGVHPLPGDQRQQVLAMAHGDRGLMQWRKSTAPCRVEGLQMPAEGTFRDPFVWRDGKRWLAVMAGHHRGLEGILLLESDDCESWRNLGQLIAIDAPDLAQPYTVLECPNLFPLAGRDVLLVSHQLHWGVFYWVGSLVDGRFEHGTWRAFAPNSRLYAPLTFLDRHQRRILIGYCEEARTEAAIATAGWCNTMTLPMQLTLGADGVLHAEPIAEVATLRGEPITAPGSPGIPSEPIRISSIQGTMFELELRVDVSAARALHVDVLCSDDGLEHTRITWERERQRLWIDTRHASQDPATVDEGGNLRRSPDAHHWFAPPQDGVLSLRIFVDRSLVEVFAHGRYINQRAYPMHDSSRGVRISAVGGAALLSLTMWPMASTAAG